MASKTASTIYRNYMRMDASLKDGHSHKKNTLENTDSHGHSHGHPHKKNTLKNMDSKSSLNALA